MTSTAQIARFLARENRLYRRRQSQLDSLLGGPKLREECGVFGIIGIEKAGEKAALGLHSLQHRGQEAAGIITTDGSHFYQEKKLGLVSDHFSDEVALASLQGHAAIGHTRYSTTGDTIERNIQPLYADLHQGGIALAHNGNLTNSAILREQYTRKGGIFHSTTDSELFMKATARSPKATLLEKLIDGLAEIEGAYALCVLTANSLIGVRDPVGIRPLVLGRTDCGAWVLASETCALDLVGAKYERDVRPGEVVECKADGTLVSHQVFPPRERARPCIFELIYFARPDSFVDGKSVYGLRCKLGEALAKEAPVEADFVSPIPDSGVPAAIGYADASGLPYHMALIRSHYPKRTFIQPSQEMRRAGVRRKHAPNRELIEGKRVVLIDDSLVRGTTSREITAMMRAAGAKEVHFRIACPPIKYPDFYGINTPSQTDLPASHMTVDEICKDIGADSLAFLELDSLYRSLGEAGRREDDPAFTDHCFTNEYPTRLRDRDEAKDGQQMSFLNEPGIKKKTSREPLKAAE